MVRRIAEPLALLSLVAALATPGAARAERLGWVSADFCRTKSTHDRDLYGIGTGVRFASHLPVTMQGQIDGFMAQGMRFAEMKVGPVLSTTQGTFRPWFEVHLGISVSDQQWGGWESGYGAGAIIEGRGNYGAFLQVQGTASGNLESDEKLFEVRVGVSLRSDVAPPEKKFPTYP